MVKATGTSVWYLLTRLVSRSILIFLIAICVQDQKFTYAFLGLAINRILRRSNYLFRLGILIALAALTCFTAIACSSATNGASGGVQEIVIATEDDYPPCDFLKDSKHVGYNQELLELVSSQLQLNIR